MDISSDKPAKFHTRKLGYCLEKETLREKQSILIAAKNNAIRTNYVKASIDKMQQSCRCRFCGDRDDTINLMKSK